MLNKCSFNYCCLPITHCCSLQYGRAYGRRVIQGTFRYQMRDHSQICENSQRRIFKMRGLPPLFGHWLRDGQVLKFLTFCSPCCSFASLSVTASVRIGICREILWFDLRHRRDYRITTSFPGSSLFLPRESTLVAAGHVSARF